MRFRVLGTLEVRTDGDVPIRLGATKQRILLAVLLMYANRPVDATRLIDALWPRRPPRTAPVALRTYVSALRQVLTLARGGELPWLATVPGGYQLHCAPGDLDLLAFEDLAAQGRQAIVDGRLVLAAERLRRALGLWRGRPFEDVPLDSELGAELTRLDEDRLSAHETLIATQLTLGHHEDVLPELHTLIAAQPLRELLWSQWILALYRSGRRAEALRAYGDLRRHLVRELGVEPAPQLQSLHRQILADDPSLAPPFSVRTGSAPVPRQLPADIGTFTGREAELAALETLADSANPPRALVISAIDGMAGVGKTALAVHAANRLAARFPDGQLFVDLHGFTQGVPPVDLGDALDRMLRCLGVPGEQIPHDLDARAALYRTHLAGKRTLIVLDNAATEAQVRPLLPGTAGCLVLVTSRARLAGLAEAEPLSLDVLPSDDALALFIRAAGAGAAGQPQPVLAEIVRLCGHLPLAIRVAAARMRSRPNWTAARLAERLRDHQHRLSELAIGGLSVTTAIDLSYQHLPADAQRMYRLLGPHPGPNLDVHAASVLAGTSIRDTEHLLDTLVDMHLLQEPVPGRYRFHDLLRAHACAISGTEPCAALFRLFDHYAHLAGVATDLLYPYRTDRVPHIQHPTGDLPAITDRTTAAAWLDTELINLLAVAAHGSPRHTLYLSATLQPHLLTRASFDHAITLHRNASQLARASADRAGEVTALCGLGMVYLLQMRYPPAVEHFEEALGIATDLGFVTGQCTALTGLACVHRAHGRIGLATELFERALQIARDTENLTAQLEALRGLGHVHRQVRRHRQATLCLEEALEIARHTGNLDGELNALWALGHVHWLENRRDEAAACHARALEIARSTGNRVGELRALTGLGHDRLVRGNYDQAATYFAQISTIATDIGDRNSEFESLYGLGQVHRAIGRPHQAATHHQAALTIARDLGQPTDEARALHGLAHSHLDLGHPDRARHHWQHALRILTDLGVPDAEELSAEQIRAHLAALPTPRPLA